MAEELTRQISRHRSPSESSSGRVRNGSISRQISVDSAHGKSPRKSSTVDAFKDEKAGEKLIETEKAETGNVSWQVYRYYLKSIGIFSIILVLAFNILFESFSVGSNVWLGLWADDNTVIGNSTMKAGKRNTYLAVYAALGFGQGTY